MKRSPRLTQGFTRTLTQNSNVSFGLTRRRWINIRKKPSLGPQKASGLNALRSLHGDTTRGGGRHTDHISNAVVCLRGIPVLFVRHKGDGPVGVPLSPKQEPLIPHSPGKGGRVALVLKHLYLYLYIKIYSSPWGPSKRATPCERSATHLPQLCTTGRAALVMISISISTDIRAYHPPPTDLHDREGCACDDIYIYI